MHWLIPFDNMKICKKIVFWFSCHIDILGWDILGWDILGWAILTTNVHSGTFLVSFPGSLVAWNNSSVTSVFLALKQYFCEVAISSYSGANNVSLCARNATCQNNSLATPADMEEGENQLYAVTIITRGIYWIRWECKLHYLTVTLVFCLVY